MVANAGAANSKTMNAESLRRVIDLCVLNIFAGVPGLELERELRANDFARSPRSVARSRVAIFRVPERGPSCGVERERNLAGGCHLRAVTRPAVVARVRSQGL